MGRAHPVPFLIAVDYFLQNFPQQLVNGLELGSLYALIALGYTLIYGILEMLNFAHGDVYMVGAFLAAGVAGLLVHNEVAVVPAGLAVALMMLVAVGGAGLLGVGIVRIDVDRVILVTFFVASALAGMGGVLFGLRYASVDFFMGYLLGIKAFTAAVIGGIGNIRGAMVGGLLLGVLESLVGGFISSQFQDTFVFLALITVLLIRPQGLFGQPLADRA